MSSIRLVCVQYICLNTQLYLQNLEYHDRLVKQGHLLYELAQDEEYVSGEMEQSTEKVEFVYLEIILHFLLITIMQSFILFYLQKREEIETQGNPTDEGDPVKKDNDQIEKDDDQIEKSEVKNEQGEDRSEQGEDHCAKGGVQSEKDEVLRENAKVPEGE